MTDLLDVPEFDHLVGQQSQGQACLAFFVSAGQGDQVCFRFRVEGVRFEVLWVLVIEGGVESLLYEALSNTTDGSEAGVEHPVNLLIVQGSHVQVGEEKDASMRELSGVGFPGTDEASQAVALFAVESHGVFHA